MEGPFIRHTIDSTWSRPHRFVAIGDGGSGLPAQQEIARRMLFHHDQSPYDLVLLLGDNIYPNGDTIRYGEHRFTALYQPLLARQVQFRPVLGNHDISGPLGVGFPTLWMSNQTENMRFFDMPAPYYDFVMGELHFFMLNTNRFRQRQRDWLDRALQHSTARWKIVCGHHPIESSGFHGPSDYLHTHLKPRLIQHRASLYLCAHEHHYERFAPWDDVTTQITSGGGGADLRRFRTARPGSCVRQSQHHFLSGTITANTLDIAVYNIQGVCIDQVHLAPPRQPALRPERESARES